MPQIVIIQAAPQSIPTDTAPAKTTPNQFVPHLEKATAKTTPATSDTVSKNLAPTTGQSLIDPATLEAAEIFTNTPVSFDIDPDTATVHIEKNFFESPSLVNATNISIKELRTSEEELPDSLWGKTGGNLFDQPMFPSFTHEKAATVFPLQAAANTTDVPLKVDITGTASQHQNDPLSPPAKEQIILQQVEHGKELSNLPQNKNWSNPLIQPISSNLRPEITDTTLSLRAPANAVDAPLKIDIRGALAQTPANPLPPVAQNQTVVQQMQPGKEFPNLSLGKNSTGSLIQSAFSASRSEITAAPLSPPASVDTVDAPLKVDITGLSMTDKNNPLPPTAQSQTLLLQLQQIINNSNETGTVSIKTTVNDYSLQYHGEEGARSAGIVSSQILEPGKIAEKPGSKLPALRQDMQAQYMEARINAKEQADSWPHTKNNEQQTNTNSQQTSTPLQSNSTPVPEQSTGFQHISTLMQELHTNQAHNSIKTVILPSGTVVNEDNVIQQVVERFHINNRANDTKISLQLHPEELGQLKIDLTLKEGSIKVHVIAQSQHVLEIIEKNIIKLRNILEDQGLRIEELAVTSESDSVPEFDLFEQHLSQQRDSATATIDTQNHKDFDMALEDAVEKSIDSSTGVNIKV